MQTMMHDNETVENPDRMTPAIAILGYGGAVVLMALMFALAAPVTG
jgi:hypothetical protein